MGRCKTAVFKRAEEGDIATPNGMVALRETMTKDTCILNAILDRVGVLLRALLQVRPQTSDRVLALGWVTVEKWAPLVCWCSAATASSKRAMSREAG